MLPLYGCSGPEVLFSEEHCFWNGWCCLQVQCLKLPWKQDCWLDWPPQPSCLGCLCYCWCHMDTGFSGGFITVHGLTLTLLMRGYLKGNGLRLVSILSYGFINDDVLYKQWHLKFIDIGHLASFRKIGSPAFWIGARVLGPTRKALGDMKQWKKLVQCWELQARSWAHFIFFTLCLSFLYHQGLPILSPSGLISMVVVYNHVCLALYHKFVWKILV